MGTVRYIRRKAEQGTSLAEALKEAPIATAEGNRLEQHLLHHDRNGLEGGLD